MTSERVVAYGGDGVDPIVVEIPGPGPIELFERRPVFKAMQYDGTNAAEIAKNFGMQVRTEYVGETRRDEAYVGLIQDIRMGSGEWRVLEPTWWVVVGPDRVELVYRASFKARFEPAPTIVT